MKSYTLDELKIAYFDYTAQEDAFLTFPDKRAIEEFIKYLGEHLEG